MDDDQINIYVAKSYLSSVEKFNLEIAFNGLQAVEIVKKKAQKQIFFDFILMDCNMPVMDGFEATTIILEMIDNGEVPPLVIIAITANASDIDHKKCFRVGMKEFLSKPYKKEQLMKILDSYKGK